MKHRVLPGIYGRPAAASLWTPADLAVSPRLWLSDESNVVLIGATDSIGEWESFYPDQAISFDQQDSDDTPQWATVTLNGHNAAECDGTSQYLIGVGSEPVQNGDVAAWCLSIYRKKTVDVSGTNRGLFCITNTSVSNGTRNRFCVMSGRPSSANSHTLLARRVETDSTSELVGSANDGGWHMHLDLIDVASRTGQLWLDGELDAENTAFTTVGASFSGDSNVSTLGAYPDPTIPVGGRFFSDADIACVIYGYTVLTTDEINRLFGWAAHRYGLSGLLDAMHPYKTSPP